MAARVFLFVNLITLIYNLTMQETPIDNTVEKKRLDVKTRNQLQICIIKEMMMIEDIKDELTWYDNYGGKVTEILNDQDHFTEIEKMIQEKGQEETAHFVINLLKEKEKNLEQAA